tara:strand:+ start:1350 stop:1736 length:387 start_codon:yes stop_codon:yes gene_type:complete
MKVMMTTIVAVLLMGCATILPPDLAICDAVQKGDVEAAKQAIADGADVNAKGEEGTPLHYASMMGHKEVAGMLITNGADVNAKDKDDSTSFHCAAAFGDKETAELLLRSITIASRDWCRYCAALPDSR